MFDMSEWSVLAALPVTFLIILGTAFVARVLLLRHRDPERRVELQSHADKVLTPISASLAFLIGFCITITATSLNTGQTHVEGTAGAAREVIWAQDLDVPGSPGAISVADSEDLSRGLVAFLDALATQDSAGFQSDQVVVMPSTIALRAFEKDVYRVLKTGGVNATQASALESAAVALATAHAEIIAVSRRALPPLLTALMFVTALLLAVVMGMSMAGVRRPVLMVAWCFVTALSVCVVLQLDRPFNGTISVNLEPISDVSTWITSGVYDGSAPSAPAR